MKKRIRKLLWKALGRPPGYPKPRVGSDATLIEKAARFTVCEMVEGDYLEFGVYRGHSFVAAYRAITEAFRQRISQEAGGASAEQQGRRRRLWEQMRFFAFDSFEGLPELRGIDLETEDFAGGQYAASKDEFIRSVTDAGVPLEKVVTLPGWFRDTTRPEVFDSNALRKASIVWIDGDLYESARDALHGITPLLQDGTVLIFDDWFAFRGNPDLGEQRAFREWASELDGFVFTEFHKEGTWRNSFIACRKRA